MEFNGFLDIPRKAMALGETAPERDISQRNQRKSMHFEVCPIEPNFGSIRHTPIWSRSGPAGDPKGYQKRSRNDPTIDGNPTQV